jgi:two-component system, OmpR family, KDP operon response regulator KdpE
MSAAPLKVLVVDDEPPIRKLLRMGLGKQGYEVLEAPNGKTALELLSEKPDLVVLDLGLPDIQGLELLRMIRGRNEGLPIVVLSSRGDEVGKVEALDLGADDYVTKPFGMDELLARMRAALRHQLQVHGERPVFRTGELSVDLVRRIVKVGDREVKLSPKEYDLLRVLVQHAGKVLTHKFLLGELWDDLTDAQYLRVYVRQLRQKVEADHEQPQYILTETGIVEEVNRRQVVAPQNEKPARRVPAGAVTPIQFRQYTASLKGCQGIFSRSATDKAARPCGKYLQIKDRLPTGCPQPCRSQSAGAWIRRAVPGGRRGARPCFGRPSDCRPGLGVPRSHPARLTAN